MYFHMEKLKSILTIAGLLLIFLCSVVSECQIPGPKSRTSCDGSFGGMTEQDCYTLPDICCWDTSVPGVAWCYKDTSTTAFDDVTFDFEITSKAATVPKDITDIGKTTEGVPGVTSQIPTESPNQGTSSKIVINPSTEKESPPQTTEPANVPMTTNYHISTKAPELNPSTEGDDPETTPSDSGHTTKYPNVLSTINEEKLSTADKIDSTVKPDVTTEVRTTVPPHDETTTTTTAKPDTTVKENNPTTQKDTTTTTIAPTTTTTTPTTTTSTTITTTLPLIEATTDVTQDNSTNPQGGGGIIEWWGYLLIGVGSAVALIAIIILISLVAKRCAANDLFAHELLTYDPPKHTMNGNNAVAFDVSGNKDAIDLDDIIAEPARNQSGSLYTEKSGFEYKGQNSFSNPSYSEGAAAF